METKFFVVLGGHEVHQPSTSHFHFSMTTAQFLYAQWDAQYHHLFLQNQDFPRFAIPKTTLHVAGHVI